MIASSLFSCAHWRRGVPTSLLVGGSSAACLVILYFIIGRIPVNNGAGWDGSVYLGYLQQLAAGGALPADPYRTIRLSGFLPLLGAAAFGVSTDTLLQLQTVINIGLASAAAALLHDTMRHLGASSRVATVTLATTLASWVFLVMPFYYPVLSDNIALPLSCLSLWCWARSHRKTLYLTLACSVWLMPGLFLVPLVLAAFAREHDCTDAAPVRKAWVLALSVACAAFLLPQLVHLLATFSDAQVSSHSSSLGGQTALLSLRTASVAAVAASAGLILWLLARAACDPGVWKSLGIGSTVLALLILGANTVAMFTLLDWTQGFAGPPLLEFMMLQSLAAPFKPLVAHLLAFGPVSLLAIAACVAWGAGRAPRLPKALVLCMVGFLPLLLIGSESRQWIGVLPIAAVLVALSDLGWYQRLWSLAVVIGLALPSFWLPDAILNALNEGLSFQSPQWQFYFGRQGPWMSTDVYGLGMLILVAWGLVMAGLYALDRRAAG